jgi:hypothetical protein
VLCFYRGGGNGRYTHCVLVLVGGEEISGAVTNEALAALEARLAVAAAIVDSGAPT